MGKPKDLMGEMNKYDKYEIRTEMARDQTISMDRLDKKQKFNTYTNTFNRAKGLEKGL